MIPAATVNERTFKNSCGTETGVADSHAFGTRSFILNFKNDFTVLDSFTLFHFTRFHPACDFSLVQINLRERIKKYKIKLGSKTKTFLVIFFYSVPIT